jgi:histidinol-phosphate/aromatic aminotransferase/cobyric acid decarboxylase-like protein
MRRFLDYYRQFQELSPEEISRELLGRRAAERARALAEVPPLDLTSAAWHEPPDPEAVNAATYALRRAVNAYPDTAPLHDAIADRHGIAPAQVAAGHGAGELLHATLRAVAADGEVAIAWPAWGPLPRLVHQAGAEPIPVPLAGGAPDADALLEAVGPKTRAVVLCSPNDPTGAVMPPDDLRRLAARLDDAIWLIVDGALAEFAGAPDDLVGGARERVVVVRSFSKAHAMAGFRAGYALANDRALLERVAPAGGVSAPAQAAMLWALRDGDAVVARRRARAARERERLAAGLRGTPLSFPAGHGHLVWLGSTAHDGREIARHLAAQRIYVTPGAAWGDDRHVRIALRDPAATDRLIAALRELTPGTRRA